jgi:hypothetical protein
MVLVTLLVGDISLTRIRVLYWMAFMTTLECPIYLFFAIHKLCKSPNTFLPFCKPLVVFNTLRCLAQFIGHCVFVIIGWNELPLGFKIFYCILPLSWLYQIKTIQVMQDIHVKFSDKSKATVIIRKGSTWCISDHNIV